MNNRTQLGEQMQTTCTHCNSRFLVSQQQLETVRGKVRCGQCMRAFNALTHLENYQGEPVTRIEPGSLGGNPDSAPEDDPDLDITPSLSEAMYGERKKRETSLQPLLWPGGIALLIIMIVVQIIYYQRYELIASPQYQGQIMNLCGVLPCDDKRFASPSQIRMLERNVFSHPTQSEALMVTGSFINEAPFDQALPQMLISLSDIQGNLIANRLFKAEEYLRDRSVRVLPAGKPVLFQLEIIDPGSQALTYEFEFLS